MAPPKIVKVQCYLYRDTGSKLWTAESGDLPGCKVTCIQPEDTLRRFNSLVLETLSNYVMSDAIPLSSNLQIIINCSIVSQEEASNLLIKPNELDN